MLNLHKRVIRRSTRCDMSWVFRARQAMGDLAHLFRDEAK
jgi:hypothetical protein